ncbi:hypothetical protein [Thermococcus sp.]|uniref:hypothetical protein n=1 Tax=Thermococcus sp. TaxID=35749 RepID=UPI002635D248|nr:hypothetical protein [Thermococcus sp.]
MDQRSGHKPYNDIIEMEVVDLLRFYGFTATAEAPVKIPEGGWGRVDVAGRKGNVSVGVEVVVTGDVARDAKKLSMNPFDYRYIIATKYPKQVDEIIVNGKRIKVVDSVRSFEHELRRDLGVPPDYPYFSKTNEEKPPEVFVGTSEREINRIIEELEEYGLENFADDVLNALGKIYISRNLPVEVRVHYNPMTGPTAPNEYESVNIKPQVLSILQRLNLVDISRKGTGYARKAFASPSERGLKAGHELILKRIRDHKAELEELAREYGDKLWIILYGSLWYTLDHFSLEVVLKEYEYTPTRGGYTKEDSILKAAKNVRVLGRYHYFDLDYMEPPENPTILMFSNFLVKTALRDDALRFFSELERYGLAIQDTERNSRGEPIYDVFKAPIEVFQYLATKTKRLANLGYYAQKFGVLYTILTVGDLYDPGVARRGYDELLQKLELNESAVAEVLADMNRRGITSRLITNPEKAPFIILDRKGFEDYLKFSLATISDYFNSRG